MVAKASRGVGGRRSSGWKRSKNSGKMRVAVKKRAGRRFWGCREYYFLRAIFLPLENISFFTIDLTHAHAIPLTPSRLPTAQPQRLLLAHHGCDIVGQPLSLTTENIPLDQREHKSIKGRLDRLTNIEEELWYLLIQYITLVKYHGDIWCICLNQQEFAVPCVGFLLSPLMGTQDVQIWIR